MKKDYVKASSRAGFRLTRMSYLLRMILTLQSMTEVRTKDLLQATALATVSSLLLQLHVQCDIVVLIAFHFPAVNSQLSCSAVHPLLQ